MERPLKSNIKILKIEGSLGERNLNIRSGKEVPMWGSGFQGPFTGVKEEGVKF